MTLDMTAGWLRDIWNFCAYGNLVSSEFGLIENKKCISRIADSTILVRNFKFLKAIRIISGPCMPLA